MATGKNDVNPAADLSMQQEAKKLKKRPQLCVALTERQQEQLREEAERNEMSISEYVRHVLNLRSR